MIGFGACVLNKCLIFNLTFHVDFIIDLLLCADLQKDNK